MGELNLLDAINFTRDLMQKHSAKKYLASPEYQGAYDQFQQNGNLPNSLVSQTTNPYVKNALDTAIRAKLDELSGRLSGAQTNLANAGALSTTGREARDQTSFLTSGFKTPEYRNAGTQEKVANEGIAQAGREREFLGPRGYGPSVGTGRIITDESQNKNQGRAIDVQEAHGNNMAMVEGLKALAPLFPFDNLKNNFSDVMSSLGGVPGVLGNFATNMGKAQAGRASQQKADLAALTGGVAKPGTAPQPDASVANPYEAPAVQNAGMAFQRTARDMKPKQPVSWMDALLGSLSGLTPGGGRNSGLSDTSKVNDLVKNMNVQVSEIRKQMANLNTLDKTTSSGYNKYNRAVQNIQALSKPVMDVYPHLEKMGYKAPPDLQKLMQDLMQLGRPINPPLDTNLKTQ